MLALLPLSPEVNGAAVTAPMRKMHDPWAKDKQHCRYSANGRVGSSIILLVKIMGCGRVEPGARCPTESWELQKAPGFPLF